MGHCTVTKVLHPLEVRLRTIDTVYNTNIAQLRERDHARVFKIVNHHHERNMKQTTNEINTCKIKIFITNRSINNA